MWIYLYIDICVYGFFGQFYAGPQRGLTASALRIFYDHLKATPRMRNVRETRTQNASKTRACMRAFLILETNTTRT